MSRRFDERVAIVTGGADGIGMSVAARLAREGAQVVIVDRDRAKAEAAVASLREGGLRLECAVLDVSEEEPVRDAFQRVCDRHGRLDVLVHCAAIVGPNGIKLPEVSVEDFDAVYRVNLRASFLVTKFALRHMQTADYGRILLFASIAGKEGNAGMSAYSTTKAAVIGMVKAVGKEYAETGITINAIAPAVIRTAMVASMDPEQVKYMTDKIPMKRCGTLDEIASLSTWIVSEEASFNTGACFDLTGGRAVY